MGPILSKPFLGQLRACANFFSLPRMGKGTCKLKPWELLAWFVLG
jgi:hypothetical protein